MKLATRVVLPSLLCALVCLAAMPVSASAQDAIANDFTKGMGKWILDKAEGKVETEGLKITKVEQYGGILAEGTSANLTGFTAITFDLQNAGDKPLALTCKIGSGSNKVGDDFTLDAGKSMTYTRSLDGLDIDLKAVTYIKLFVNEAGPVNFIIKKAALVGSGTSQPASKTADTPTAAPAAGATPFDNDFTVAMGKWKLDAADGKLTPGEGLKLTDMKQSGGVILTCPPVALSGKVKIDLENTGKEAAALVFKIKSGSKPFSKDFSAEPGKSTFELDLADVDNVDLKKIDYMKIFGSGPLTVTIKKITVAK